MKKHVYYETTKEDKELIIEFIRRFNGLVGHLPDGEEDVLKLIYGSDFNPATIHAYNKAWHILEKMLGMLNEAKYRPGLLTQRNALESLYIDIRAHQNDLSDIFKEFEAEGIYVD